MIAAMLAQNSSLDTLWVVLIGFAVIVLLLMGFFLFNFIQLWVQSILTKANIGPLDMLRMKLVGLDYAVLGTSADPDEARKARYRETEHVRRFYATNRY